jgi:hypothetical protein
VPVSEFLYLLFYLGEAACCAVVESTGPKIQTQKPGTGLKNNLKNGDFSTKKAIVKKWNRNMQKSLNQNMKFGGAAEIRTQVARPPALQDGPSYPTAPQSKLCFFNGKPLSCSPSSTIVIKYVV